MNKNIKLTNLLLIGLFIISLGIIIIVVNVSFYELIIFIFSVFIIINALYNIINYFLKHKKLNLINSIINIILGYLMLIIPKIPLSVLPIIFAIYIIFNGIVKMVNAYQMYKNKVKGKWSEGGSALVYIVFGIILLFSPLIHIRIVLNIIGIYLVLYGLSFIGDFISTIIPTKTKKNLKRKVRITLPVFIAAFVPHKVLKELNEFLQDSKEYTYLKTDKEVKSDIEILIP